MKEHPILFSAPMVRAILEGRKTQTRRTVKKQPAIDPQTGDWLFTYLDGNQEVLPIEKWIDIQVKLHCPFGKIGDLLWVRETFGQLQDEDGGGYVYRADVELEDGEGFITQPWRPSIFMPRCASRILLKITDIRIERLQQITISDSIREGIESFRPAPGEGRAETLYRRYSDVGGRPGNWISIPELSFRSLWESINCSQSWIDNPFVWVISFIRLPK